MGLLLNPTICHCPSSTKPQQAPKTRQLVLETYLFFLVLVLYQSKMKDEEKAYRKLALLV